MTVLFVPIGRIFNANSIAGAGQVQQFIYTVPALKRAVLTYAFVGIAPSAAAAGTVGGAIQCTCAGTGVFVNRLFNQAVLAAEISVFETVQVDLQAADTVTGFTINTAAVNVLVRLSAMIREYQ